MKLNNMNSIFTPRAPITKAIPAGNPLRPWQRYIAAFMAYFLLLQLCLPTVAMAATMLSNGQFSTVLNSPVYRVTGNASGAMYARPNYLQVDTQSGTTIASFHKSLTGSALADPALVVGDEFVQQRLIRAQVSMLLGRTLVDSASLLLSSASKKAYELTQSDALFAAGVAFGKGPQPKAFGTPLSAQDTIPNDMIWPEKRNINGKEVIIPVVYLNSATLATQPQGHQINLGLSTLFNNIEVNRGVVVSAAGNENYQAVINSLTDILNAGTINGTGNLKLVAGNTFTNLSGKVKADNNLDITTKHGDVINKTQLISYQSKDGSGTRLAAIATIDANGSITIGSAGGITYTGGSSNALYGALTFNAVGDIVLAPAATSSQSTTKDGGWTINKSSFELMQSKLTTNQMLTLMAGGKITITASELYSTQGGIELLAQHGIYIADEQGNFQSNRVDKLGKKTGTGSDFESFAIRTVLSAGKGILLKTESGDVELKGAKITAGEGTQVKAVNGKVRLLITKENSQHYLDTVKKGMWTIKTVHEEYIKETGIPNAIVGGLAVEALAGVDIEYAGREGATLAEQIDEYEKMPDTKWMADIYKGNTKFKDANGNIVALNTVVDFSKVDLAYKHIREHNTSLSPAAMAIIAICVAVAMGPGAGLIGNGGGGLIGGLASNATYGAMLNAGALTLTTSAVQNLAAGKSLDETLKAMTTDDALKNLAISMATAGALSALDGKLELFDKTQVGATPQLAFVNQAYQAVVQSTVTAGISVTINGGNSDDYLNAFKVSLATNAINTIGQNLTNKISNSTSLNEASKYIAHAAMGCLTQGLTAKLSDADFKDVCASAAAGAVIAQVAVDLLESKATEAGGQILNAPDKITPTNIDSTLGYLGANGVDLSKFLAGIIAFAAGGDVNAAASGAGMTAQSYRENLNQIAQLGNLMNAMGMIGCDSNNFVQCNANAAQSRLRNILKAEGKYSNQEIETEIQRQDALGIFTAAAKFNKAYLQDVVLNDMAGRNVNGVGSIDEVLILGTKYSELQGAIRDYTGALQKGFEAGSAIAGDSIKKLLDEPIYAPLKQTLAFVAAKGAALVKAIPGAETALQAQADFEAAMGVGALSYVLGTTYDSLKEEVNDPLNKDQIEATSAKGMSLIGSQLIGLATAGASKAFIVTKYIRPGKDRFEGDGRHECSCALGHCFAASTLVKTKKGFVEIEKVKKGDLVASKDEKTNAIAWKPVTQLFQYDDDRTTFELVVQTKNGLPETFEVTNNHPFYVLDTGWVDSGNLKQGMKLTSYKNNVFEVKSLTPLDRSPVTYNFEVADFHTFFVGKSEVWVHNQGSCDCSIAPLPRHPNWIPVTDIAKKVDAIAAHVLTIDLKNGAFIPDRMTLNGVSYDVEGFSGCHTENALKTYSANNGGTYDIKNKILDENDVYEGQPVITLNGKEYVKINGKLAEYAPSKVGGTASFFPESWSDARIKDEVAFAVENNRGVAPNQNSPTLYHGFSKDGKIEIRFAFTTKSDGSITGTYYPVRK